MLYFDSFMYLETFVIVHFVFVRVCECVYICLLVQDGLRWRMICEEGCSNNPLHQTYSCLVGLESNEQLSPTIKEEEAGALFSQFDINTETRHRHVPELHIYLIYQTAYYVA